MSTLKNFLADFADASRQYAQLHPLRTFLGISPAILTLTIAVLVLLVALTFRYLYTPGKKRMFASLGTFAMLIVTFIVITFNASLAASQCRSHTLGWNIVFVTVGLLSMIVPIYCWGKMLQRKWRLP